MAFDCYALAAACREINKSCADTRINKVHMPDRHTLLLRFHGREGQGKLLLSAHPQQGRIQLTELSYENLPSAPPFLMAMRKWLEGAAILGIRQTAYERVAELELIVRDGIGDRKKARLIIEIMGKHSNIILVDANDRIIDGIRRYDSTLSQYREVLPGCRYLPPPPLDKLLPPIEPAALREQLVSSEPPLAATVKARIAGLSPLAAKEILAGLPAEPRQLDGEDWLRLSAELERFARIYEGSEGAPTLLQPSTGASDVAAWLPAAWEAQPHVQFDSISAALDACYAVKNRDAAFSARRRKLEKLLAQQIGRMEKKIGLQEQDLEKFLGREDDKLKGDMLAAYQYYLKKGLADISLPSFEDPNVLVGIELDPGLTPQENITRYYRRYSKAKKGRDHILPHLTQNREEQAYLQSISAALDMAEADGDLNALEQELLAAGYIKKQPEKRKDAKKDDEALPPRRVVSADGFTILIGRNNRQNDRLTLKEAAATDIWLHAQKIPGSHVIVRAEGRPVPDSTIAEAAAYAAWYSKGGSAGKTAVDYTTADQVKKPAGAKPGMVIYFQQKTLYVEPKEPKE
ncbi:MAG: NFACT family protein [Firmicutes bacterium]|nr:NFACT family protein [Bacillota bacterium]